MAQIKVETQLSPHNLCAIAHNRHHLHRKFPQKKKSYGK